MPGDIVNLRQNPDEENRAKFGREKWDTGFPSGIAKK
jgi:hypothetical protein